jgi:hypothetical protein
MNQKKHPGDDTDFYEAYSNNASKLRLWLISYGIGAPVLFVSQSSISSALNASGCGRKVILLFLIGVSLQILATYIYKTIMWYAYLGESKESFKSTRRFKFSDWFSELYWPEFVFDWGSIVLFIIATYKALTVTIK